MEYDFGDGWEIKLTLEAVIEDKELPRVLEGEGYGIIEDCGGPGGLERITEALQKKSGEEYKNLRTWLGWDELDLSSVDVTDMNFRLKKVPRIYRDLYEFGFAPTQQSINLLERKYLNSAKSRKRVKPRIESEGQVLWPSSLLISVLESCGGQICTHVF